jgi:hypothetical protein
MIGNSNDRIGMPRKTPFIFVTAFLVVLAAGFVGGFVAGRNTATSSKPVASESVRIAQLLHNAVVQEAVITNRGKIVRVEPNTRLLTLAANGDELTFRVAPNATILEDLSEEERAAELREGRTPLARNLLLGDLAPGDDVTIAARVESGQVLPIALQITRL